MAKFVKEVLPTEKSYVVELTESEVDMLLGIVTDLCDNPQREVSMVYGVDESVAIPTAHGQDVLQGILNGLGKLTKDCEHYDYEDYWEMYALKELDYKTT